MMDHPKRDMSWDSQLNSILSVADGSVAKMRERLTSAGKFPKGAEVKESVVFTNLDPPASHAALPVHKPPSSLGSGVQWADLAAVQSQLQIHSQLIESLTQKLHDLEREKQSQQYHIQTLQEEVRSLREELRVRSREREDLSSGVERRMEQWRMEVGRELSSLRGNIAQAASRGNLEESFSSTLRQDELQHLRRELDALKTRIRRQEEDTHLQQTEARETRRQYERSCKMLEELTGSYRTHSSELTKTLRQYSQTQQDVHQMRTTVSELKNEVRGLTLRGQESPPLLQAATSGASPLLAPPSRSRGLRSDEADSDSEDFSPTPSLAEISSDDLSWLEDKDPAPRRRAPPSVRSTPSDFAGPGSDAEDGGDDLLDGVDDDDRELESDLSLKDL
ncbi:trichohyalin isoform X2 [Fundulus heteroclitus]|uniref:trichohyalin isoform X2 n=1 Tax=Fundulus heteroclitus TaxID=8078 RepID=UPI00165BC509|nr:trichohyalin isoform X2 [Fundulus heteroclitus]